MERAELSTHLSLERVDPVATASGPVAEQTSREGGSDERHHRRAPLPEDASPELTGLDDEGIEAGSERPPEDRLEDRPEHRIDSLA